jgi:hypothetical protein
LPIDIDRAELALTSPVEVMVADLAPNALDDSEFTIELLSELVPVASVANNVCRFWYAAILA